MPGNDVVRRLAWSQLRFRAGRAVALLAGMLVAATAFTVLTAAARTAQIRTIGTVSAHFRPAYDILVRPSGARSRLESATGTVQPDFLSGIYGGITMAQYHQIQHISGVQVAAPIAMVGYDFMDADFPVTLPADDVARPGRQPYRVSTTWVSANGATRIKQPPTYVYVTPDRVHQNAAGGTSERLPDGPTATPCPATGTPTSPFSAAAQSQTWCWSKIDGDGAPGILISPALHGHIGFGVDWQFPMLIAAIDPAAEAKLDRLNHALTSGRYLPDHGFGNGPEAPYFQRHQSFPVLAASDSGIGEYSVTKVQELATPSAPPVLDPAAMRKDATAPGHPVLSTTINAQHAYRYLLARLGNRLGRLVDSAVAGRRRDLLRTTGQCRPPGPHAAAARGQRQRHLPGTVAGRHVRPGEDRRVRPAVPGAAGAVSADGGPAGQRGQPERAGRVGAAAQPQPGRLRQPAGAAGHHAGRAAHAGEREVLRRRAAGPRPGQRDPGPGGRGNRPESGLAQPDQVGRRADRGADPPDGGHRGRVLPGADHGHAAREPVGHLLFAAAAAAVTAGIAVTCAAALLPAQLLRRLPAARLLAEE
jgi:hypothetical protein